MNNRCIVWDFDNTLAKRKGKWSSTLQDVVIRNGHNNIPIEDLRPHFKGKFPWNRHTEPHSTYMHNGWWHYMNGVIKEVIINQGIIENVDLMVEEFKHEYMKIDTWALFDDTIDTLKTSISNGFDNIILSNHIPELETIVSGLGISKYFRAIYSSANMGFDKPNQNLYKVITDNYNYNTYYMVGDNYEADILGSAPLGFIPILVHSDDHTNYDRYAKNLSDIWPFI